MLYNDRSLPRLISLLKDKPVYRLAAKNSMSLFVKDYLVLVILKLWTELPTSELTSSDLEWSMHRNQFKWDTSAKHILLRPQWYIQLFTTRFCLPTCVRLIKYKRAGPSENGAYGVYDVMRADDVLYDVTVGYVTHASQTL